MFNKIKNICCIGAGYVGGPTMSVFADKCPEIIINVVDLNRKRIEDWNEKDLSKLPVYEPGLTKIISRCRNKNLFFSTDIEKNLQKADMIFISVNTPTKKSGIGAGKASDLSYVEASTRQIAKYAKTNTIIVEKSTLPVRTADTIKNILSNSNDFDKNSELKKKFYILSNPEFLSEGNAIKDLESPDRVLIGGENKEAINELKNIYLNWVDDKKIITTNIWSAELSKLASNAFLAQRISSINSLSALCEASGADIKEVKNAIGSDSRIGNKFINPGPGFGGSCFKKDILNLVYLCEFYNLKEVALYWQNVLDLNQWQKNRLTKVVVEKLFGNISEKKIAILGFAFKSKTNDTRESSAIDICKNLLQEGSNLSIYDPKVKAIQVENALKIKENINLDSHNNANWHFSKSIQSCIEGSDAVLILTEWAEFEHLDWNMISKKMRKPSWVFDTRCTKNLDLAKKYGLNVWKIGNGKN